MEFGLHVPRRAKIFCAAMLASCTLLAPAKSNAQLGQPIVMRCTWNPNPSDFTNMMTLTIDLAKKTVTQRSGAIAGSESFNLVRQGTVTEVTDQQITWVADARSGVTGPFVLDRYTGQMSIVLSPTVTSFFTCKKQQKQF